MTRDPEYAWWRDPYWQTTLLAVREARQKPADLVCRACGKPLGRSDGVTPTCTPHYCRACRRASLLRIRGLA